MQVIATLTRTDLLAFNLYLLPRARANVIMFWLLALGVFAFLIVDKPITTPRLAAVAVTSLLAAAAGLLMGFLFSAGFVLLASTEKSGTLGKHTYTLRPEGLHEVTVANEALHRWSGIQRVARSKRFIYMPINSYLYHVIPRHAFETEQDFQSFWERAHALWSQAAA